MIKTITYVDVQFNDLDPMNIVWHGNYLKYLEQARCEMFNKIKYTYMDMYNDGYMYPIAKMSCKFIKSARFGDRLKIVSKLVDIEPSIEIKYTIYNAGTDEKLFTAKTMQIGVIVETGESFFIAPENLKMKINNYEDFV